MEELIQQPQRTEAIPSSLLRPQNVVDVATGDAFAIPAAAVAPQVVARSTRDLGLLCDAAAGDHEKQVNDSTRLLQNIFDAHARQLVRHDMYLRWVQTEHKPTRSGTSTQAPKSMFGAKAVRVHTLPANAYAHVPWERTAEALSIESENPKSLVAASAALVRENGIACYSGDHDGVTSRLDSHAASVDRAGKLLGILRGASGERPPEDAIPAALQLSLSTGNLWALLQSIHWCVPASAADGDNGDATSTSASRLDDDRSTTATAAATLRQAIEAWSHASANAATANQALLAAGSAAANALRDARMTDGDDATSPQDRGVQASLQLPPDSKPGSAAHDADIAAGLEAAENALKPQRGITKAAEKLLKAKRMPLPASVRAKAEAASAASESKLPLALALTVAKVAQASTTTDRIGSAAATLNNKSAASAGKGGLSSTPFGQPRAPGAGSRRDGSAGRSGAVSNADDEQASDTNATALVRPSKAQQNPYSRYSAGSKGKGPSGKRSGGPLPLSIDGTESDNNHDDEIAIALALEADQDSDRQRSQLVKFKNHPLNAATAVHIGAGTGLFPSNNLDASQSLDDVQFYAAMNVDAGLGADASAQAQQAPSMLAAAVSAADLAVEAARAAAEQAQKHVESASNVVDAAVNKILPLGHSLRASDVMPLLHAWLIDRHSQPQSAHSTDTQPAESPSSSPPLPWQKPIIQASAAATIEPAASKATDRKQSFTWYGMAETDEGRLAAWKSKVSAARNQVWAVGQNAYGELGTGDTQPRRTPVLISSLSGLGVVSIAAGNEHTVVATSGGEALSVGYNDSGQCALGAGSPARVPSFTRIRCRSTTTAAAGVGSKEAGKTATGDGDNTTDEQSIASVHASNGCEHTFLLGADGTSCWGSGYNMRYQLGLGHAAPLMRPAPLQLSTRSTDASSNLALSIPRPLREALPIRHIACSYYHSMFVADCGAVFGCGRNDAGQLGRPFLGDAREPVLIMPLHDPAYRRAVGLFGGRPDLTAVSSIRGSPIAPAAVDDPSGDLRIPRIGRSSALQPLLDRLRISDVDVTDGDSSADDEWQIGDAGSPVTSSQRPSRMHPLPLSSSNLESANMVSPVSDVLPGSVQEAQTFRSDGASASRRFRSGTGSDSESHSFPGSSSVIGRGARSHGATSSPGSSRGGVHGSSRSQSPIGDVDATPSGGCWVRSISAGQYHSVVVLSDGRVYAAGRNDWGQIGLGPNAPACTRMFTRVTGGALSPSNGAWFSARKQMMAEISAPPASAASKEAPLLPTATVPMPIVSVACGYYHTLLLTSAGTIVTFGRNDSGMCGVGSSEPKIFEPRLVQMETSHAGAGGIKAPSGAKPPAVAGNADTKPSTSISNALAGATGGPLRSPERAVGNNASISAPNSPQMSPLRALMQSASSRSSVPEAPLHTSSAAPSGTEGAAISSVSFLPAVHLRATMVAAGCYHSVAVVGHESQSKVFSWGRNQHSQLGLGDNTERHSPTEVALPGLGAPPPSERTAENLEALDSGAADPRPQMVMGVKSIAAGFYHTVFLLSPVRVDNDSIIAQRKQQDDAVAASKAALRSKCTAAYYAVDSLVHDGSVPAEAVALAIVAGLEAEIEAPLVDPRNEEDGIATVYTLSSAVASCRARLAAATASVQRVMLQQHKVFADLLPVTDVGAPAAEPSKVVSLAPVTPLRLGPRAASVSFASSPLNPLTAALESRPGVAVSPVSLTAGAGIASSPPASVMATPSGVKVLLAPIQASPNVVGTAISVREAGASARPHPSPLLLSAVPAAADGRVQLLKSYFHNALLANEQPATIGNGTKPPISADEAQLNATVSATCACIHTSLLLYAQLQARVRVLRRASDAIQHAHSVASTTSNGTPESLKRAAAMANGAGPLQQDLEASSVALLRLISTCIVHMLRSGYGHQLAPALSLIRIQLGSSIIPAVMPGAEDAPLARALTSSPSIAWDALSLQKSDDACAYLGAFADVDGEADENGLFGMPGRPSVPSVTSSGAGLGKLPKTAPALLTEPTDVARLVLAASVVLAAAAFTAQSESTRCAGEDGIISLMELLVVSPPEVASLLGALAQHSSSNNTLADVCDTDFPGRICTALASPRFMPALEFHSTASHGEDIVRAASSAWRLLELTRYCSGTALKLLLHLLKMVASLALASDFAMANPLRIKPTQQQHRGAPRRDSTSFGVDNDDDALGDASDDDAGADTHSQSNASRDQSPLGGGPSKRMLRDTHIAWSHSSARVRNEAARVLVQLLQCLLPLCTKAVEASEHSATGRYFEAASLVTTVIHAVSHRADAAHALLEPTVEFYLESTRNEVRFLNGSTPAGRSVPPAEWVTKSTRLACRAAAALAATVFKAPLLMPCPELNAGGSTTDITGIWPTLRLLLPAHTPSAPHNGAAAASSYATVGPSEVAAISLASACEVLLSTQPFNGGMRDSALRRVMAALGGQPSDERNLRTPLFVRVPQPSSTAVSAGTSATTAYGSISKGSVFGTGSALISDTSRMQNGRVSPAGWQQSICDLLQAKAHTARFFEALQQHAMATVPAYRGALMQGKGPLRAAKSIVWRSAVFDNDRVVVVVSSDADAMAATERVMLCACILACGMAASLPAIINRMGSGPTNSATAAGGFSTGVNVAGSASTSSRPMPKWLLQCATSAASFRCWSMPIRQAWSAATSHMGISDQHDSTSFVALCESMWHRAILALDFQPATVAIGVLASPVKPLTANSNSSTAARRWRVWTTAVLAAVRLRRLSTDVDSLQGHHSYAIPLRNYAASSVPYVLKLSDHHGTPVPRMQSPNGDSAARGGAAEVPTSLLPDVVAACRPSPHPDVVRAACVAQLHRAAMQAWALRSVNQIARAQHPSVAEALTHASRAIDAAVLLGMQLKWSEFARHGVSGKALDSTTSLLRYRAFGWSHNPCDRAEVAAACVSLLQTLFGHMMSVNDVIVASALRMASTLIPTALLLAAASRSLQTLLTNMSTTVLTRLQTSTDSEGVAWKACASFTRFVAGVLMLQSGDGQSDPSSIRAGLSVRMLNSVRITIDACAEGASVQALSAVSDTTVGRPWYAADQECIVSAADADSINVHHSVPGQALRLPSSGTDADSHDMSVSFWMMVQQQPTGKPRCVLRCTSKDSSSAQVAGMPVVSLAPRRNRILVTLPLPSSGTSGRPQSTVTIASRTDFPLNKWTHVAVTVQIIGDSDAAVTAPLQAHPASSARGTVSCSVRLYCDGQLSGQRRVFIDRFADLLSSGISVHIGKPSSPHLAASDAASSPSTSSPSISHTGYQQGFEGSMRRIAVFSRCIGPDEVVKEFDEGVMLQDAVWTAAGRGNPKSALEQTMAILAAVASQCLTTQACIDRVGSSDARSQEWIATILSSLKKPAATSSVLRNDAGRSPQIALWMHVLARVLACTSPSIAAGAFDRAGCAPCPHGADAAALWCLLRAAAGSFGASDNCDHPLGNVNREALISTVRGILERGQPAWTESCARIWELTAAEVAAQVSSMTQGNSTATSFLPLCDADVSRAVALNKLAPARVTTLDITRLAADPCSSRLMESLAMLQACAEVMGGIMVPISPGAAAWTTLAQLSAKCLPSGTSAGSATGDDGGRKTDRSNERASLLPTIAQLSRFSGSLSGAQLPTERTSNMQHYPISVNVVRTYTDASGRGRAVISVEGTPLTDAAASASNAASILSSAAVTAAVGDGSASAAWSALGGGDGGFDAAAPAVAVDFKSAIGQHGSIVAASFASGAAVLNGTNAFGSWILDVYAAALMPARPPCLLRGAAGDDDAGLGRILQSITTALQHTLLIFGSSSEQPDSRCSPAGESAVTEVELLLQRSSTTMALLSSLQVIPLSALQGGLRRMDPSAMSDLLRLVMLISASHAAPPAFLSLPDVLAHARSLRSRLVETMPAEGGDQWQRIVKLEAQIIALANEQAASARLPTPLPMTTTSRSSHDATDDSASTSSSSSLSSEIDADSTIDDHLDVAPVRRARNVVDRGVGGSDDADRRTSSPRSSAAADARAPDTSPADRLTAADATTGDANIAGHSPESSADDDEWWREFRSRHTARQAHTTHAGDPAANSDHALGPSGVNDPSRNSPAGDRLRPSTSPASLNSRRFPRLMDDDVGDNGRELEGSGDHHGDALRIQSGADMLLAVVGRGVGSPTVPHENDGSASDDALLSFPWDSSAASHANDGASVGSHDDDNTAAAAAGALQLYGRPVRRSPDAAMHNSNNNEEEERLSRGMESRQGTASDAADGIGVQRPRTSSAASSDNAHGSGGNALLSHGGLIDAASVDALVSIGFEREWCIAALTVAAGDQAIAAEWIVDHLDILNGFGMRGMDADAILEAVGVHNGEGEEEEDEDEGGRDDGDADEQRTERHSTHDGGADDASEGPHGRSRSANTRAQPPASSRLRELLPSRVAVHSLPRQERPCFYIDIDEARAQGLQVVGAVTDQYAVVDEQHAADSSTLTDQITSTDERKVQKRRHRQLVTWYQGSLVAVRTYATTQPVIVDDSSVPAGLPRPYFTSAPASKARHSHRRHKADVVRLTGLEACEEDYFSSDAVLYSFHECGVGWRGAAAGLGLSSGPSALLSAADDDASAFASEQQLWRHRYYSGEEDEPGNQFDGMLHPGRAVLHSRLVDRDRERSEQDGDDDGGDDDDDGPLSSGYGSGGRRVTGSRRDIVADDQPSGSSAEDANAAANRRSTSQTRYALPRTGAASARAVLAIGASTARLAGTAAPSPRASAASPRDVMTGAGRTPRAGFVTPSAAVGGSAAAGSLALSLPDTGARGATLPAEPSGSAQLDVEAVVGTHGQASVPSPIVAAGSEVRSRREISASPTAIGDSENNDSSRSPLDLFAIPMPVPAPCGLRMLFPASTNIYDVLQAPVAAAIRGSTFDHGQSDGDADANNRMNGHNTNVLASFVRSSVATHAEAIASSIGGTLSTVTLCELGPGPIQSLEQTDDGDGGRDARRRNRPKRRSPDVFATAPAQVVGDFEASSTFEVGFGVISHQPASTAAGRLSRLLERASVTRLLLSDPHMMDVPDVIAATIAASNISTVLLARDLGASLLEAATAVAVRPAVLKTWTASSAAASTVVDASTLASTAASFASKKWLAALLSHLRTTAFRRTRAQPALLSPTLSVIMRPTEHAGTAVPSELSIPDTGPWRSRSAAATMIISTLLSNNGTTVLDQLLDAAFRSFASALPTISRRRTERTSFDSMPWSRRNAWEADVSVQADDDALPAVEVGFWMLDVIRFASGLAAGAALQGTILDRLPALFTSLLHWLRASSNVGMLSRACSAISWLSDLTLQRLSVPPVMGSPAIRWLLSNQGASILSSIDLQASEIARSITEVEREGGRMYGSSHAALMADAAVRVRMLRHACAVQLTQLIHAGGNADATSNVVVLQITPNSARLRFPATALGLQMRVATCERHQGCNAHRYVDHESIIETRDATVVNAVNAQIGASISCGQIGEADRWQTVWVPSAVPDQGQGNDALSMVPGEHNASAAFNTAATAFEVTLNNLSSSTAYLLRVVAPSTVPPAASSVEIPAAIPSPAMTAIRTHDPVPLGWDVKSSGPGVIVTTAESWSNSNAPPPKPYTVPVPSVINGRLHASQVAVTATYAGSDAWSMLLGSCGFSTGVNRWAVRIDRTSTSYIFVGVAAGNANLSHFLGSDEYGYGYLGDKALYHRHAKTASYGARFAAGDVVGVEVDCDAGTLSFSVNGVGQGVAFRHLAGKLYPAVAFYSHGQRVTLIPQYCDCRGSGTSVTGAGNASIDDTRSFSATTDALLCRPGSVMPTSYLQDAWSSFQLWREGHERRAFTKAGSEITFDTSAASMQKYGGGLRAGDRVLCARGEGEVIGVKAGRLWLRLDDDGGGCWYIDPVVPVSPASQRDSHRGLAAFATAARGDAYQVTCEAEPSPSSAVSDQPRHHLRPVDATGGAGYRFAYGYDYSNVGPGGGSGSSGDGCFSVDAVRDAAGASAAPVAAVTQARLSFARTRSVSRLDSGVTPASASAASSASAHVTSAGAVAGGSHHSSTSTSNPGHRLLHSSISEAVTDIVAVAALRDEVNSSAGGTADGSGIIDAGEGSVHAAGSTSTSTGAAGTAVLDRLGHDALRSLTSAMIEASMAERPGHGRGLAPSVSDEPEAEENEDGEGAPVVSSPLSADLLDPGRVGILVVLAHGHHHQHHSEDGSATGAGPAGWEDEGRVPAAEAADRVRLAMDGRGSDAYGVRDDDDVHRDSKRPDDDARESDTKHDGDGHQASWRCQSASRGVPSKRAPVYKWLAQIQSFSSFAALAVHLDVLDAAGWSSPADDSALLASINAHADTTGRNPWNLLPHSIVDQLEAVHGSIPTDVAARLAVAQALSMLQISATSLDARHALRTAVACARFSIIRIWNDRLRSCMPFLDYSQLLTARAVSDPALHLTSSDAASFGLEHCGIGAGSFHADQLPILARSVALARGLIFSHSKRSVLASVLERTATLPKRVEDEYEYPPDVPIITLNRTKSITTALVSDDPTVRLTESVFGQALLALHPLSGPPMRLSFSHPMDDGQVRSFRVRYAGEASDDYSGLYREMFSHVCGELQSTAMFKPGGGFYSASASSTAGPGARTSCVIPLLAPAPGRTVGDLFVLNPSLIPGATGTRRSLFDTHLHPILDSSFRFVGQLLGIALRSRISLPLALAPSIWKGLAGEATDESDVAAIDSGILAMIGVAEQAARDAMKERFGKDYADVLGVGAARDADADDDSELRAFLASPVDGYDDLTWRITLSDGSQLPLDAELYRHMYGCQTSSPAAPAAADVVVTAPDLLSGAYRAAVVHARLHEADAAMDALRQGFTSVVPAAPLPLFTGRDVEAAICGTGDIDIALLRANTEYDEGVSPEDAHIQSLWRVLESFTAPQRQAFLRFVWARSRLPASAAEFTQKFRIQAAVIDADNDGAGAMNLGADVDGDAVSVRSGQSNNNGSGIVASRMRAAPRPADGRPPQLLSRHPSTSSVSGSGAGAGSAHPSPLPQSSPMFPLAIDVAASAASGSGGGMLSVGVAHTPDASAPSLATPSGTLSAAVLGVGTLAHMPSSLRLALSARPMSSRSRPRSAASLPLAAAAAIAGPSSSSSGTAGSGSVPAMASASGASAGVGGVGMPSPRPGTTLGSRLVGIATPRAGFGLGSLRTASPLNVDATSAADATTPAFDAVAVSGSSSSSGLVRQASSRSMRPPTSSFASRALLQQQFSFPSRPTGTSTAAAASASAAVSGPDSWLPTSHTCFFSLHLPRYSSDAILKERLLYAITNCIALDADYRLPADSEQQRLEA